MEILPLIRTWNIQELHLHGNDMGNEGIRELMVGLMTHKGNSMHFILIAKFLN